MMPQVLAVKARLMQDHPSVAPLSDLCGGVNRLTAAAIFAACHCQTRRTVKVVEQARGALRNFRRDTDARAKLYEARLLQLCLEIAARTTPPKRKAHR